MTLTEFLLARIAEDRHAAEHADWAMQGKWYADADDKVDEFVREFSPARVLAECEAKRRIVEQWERISTRLQVDLDQTQGWETLRVLASVYSDHPDYRQEWRL